MPPKKKEKIPPPGNKKDEYTNFMSKMKWKAAMQKVALEIAGRNIRGPGCLLVSNAFAKNKHITTIDLSHNHLGDDGAVNLAQALKMNECIQSINIACNDITDVGGIALASAFIPSANPTGQPSQWNRSVYYLNISGNKMRDDTLLAMSNAIACHRDLSKVDISYNQVGSQGTKVLMRAMSRNNLCSINFAANDLRDEGVEFICEAWKRFGGKGAQTYLNLFRNNLGKSSGEYIGRLMENNDYISEINLAMNTLGPKGISSLTRSLLPPFQNVLKNINLSDNYMEDEGAQCVGDYIASDPPFLIKLNVNNNRITDRGGARLMRGLRTNTHLQFVMAAYNEFGKETCNQLVEVVSTAKVLKLIDVKKSNLDEDHCRKIAEATTGETRVDYGSTEDEYTMRDHMMRLGDLQLAIEAEEEKAKMKKKKKPKAKA